MLENPGATYLDIEEEFDFVERRRCGERHDLVIRESGRCSSNDAVRVPQVFVWEDDAHVGKVASLWQFRVDVLYLFVQPVDLLGGLVAFGVIGDFFLNCKRDLLYGNLPGLVHPIQVRR